jgi:hypothetical protein
MASTRVDYTAMDWTSAVPFYGPAANRDGRDIVQLKVLSDRRRDGDEINSMEVVDIAAAGPT